jgi:hypothetical protein
MSDATTAELRRLIDQNRLMEQKLRDLQLAIAGIRADFETVVAARLQGSSPCDVPETAPAELMVR